MIGGPIAIVIPVVLLILLYVFSAVRSVIRAILNRNNAKVYLMEVAFELQYLVVSVIVYSLIIIVAGKVPSTDLSNAMLIAASVVSIAMYLFLSFRRRLADGKQMNA